MKKPLLNTSEAKALMGKHSSPLYVYKRGVIENQYKNLLKSIQYPKTKLYYACKANSNKEILVLLKEAGSSIECVSRGEVERAISVGFPRERISYTCSYISREELKWVAAHVSSVHLDSLTQLEWWGEMKPHSKVSLRVNRGFGAGATSHIITGGPESKFGIYYTDLPRARKIAKQYSLTVIGLEQHIGSNISNPGAFIRAMKLLLESAKGFPDLQFMDFGGGLGIPYKPDQKALDIAILGKKLGETFAKFCTSYGRDLELRLEPGRYIVAESGCLLATVVDIKKTPKHTFVGINSGFNHLIRPAFYGSYHHIFNLTRPNAKPAVVTVVGNICESSDRFATDRKIPKPEIGDMLLLADVGAYGYTMSSDYNLRDKPKEVLVD